MKLKNVLFSGLFLSGLVSTAVLNMSSSSGQMGAFSSGCNSGTGCHGVANTATSISLTGIPSAGYVAGTNYPLTLTITNADSNMASAGFDMNFGDGTLSNNPTGTMLMGSEMHHTSPKNKTGNTVSWTFNWTAPTAATTLVNIAGNMVNGDSTQIGDQWNVATLTLTKSSAAVNNVVENPVSVYPNPCTSQLNIQMTESIQNVEVYSVYGQQQDVNGTLRGNLYELNTSNLSEGLYFVFVQSEKVWRKSTFMKQ